MGSMIIYKRYG